jgi:uncharacterized protein
MPSFVNPFSGLVPRKISHGELVRAIMLDIAAELEAVHAYMAHMEATDNEDAKKVLYDIALEELVHVGEFTSLLYRLDPLSAQKAQEGFAEVQDLLKSLSPAIIGTVEQETVAGQNPEPQMPIPQGLTVGSLIGVEQ